jgi:hypothetical protein
MKMDRTGYVTVMLSHDYCHFEVSLPLPVCEQADAEYLQLVDSIRKDAMRLADKAVKQYKIAKANAQKLISEKQSRGYLEQEVKHIREIEENRRTIEQQATLKAYDDKQWQASRRYDYDDDWEDDDDYDSY